MYQTDFIGNVLCVCWGRGGIPGVDSHFFLLRQNFVSLLLEPLPYPSRVTKKKGENEDKKAIEHLSLVRCAEERKSQEDLPVRLYFE